MVDYLLKPIEEERLNKTREKVCRQIDQMREDREEKAELKQIRLRQQQTRLQEFWKDLLSRGENSTARNMLTEEQCNRAYQTEFVSGCYQALCMVSNMNGILEHADSLFSEEITRALHHFISMWQRARSCFWSCGSMLSRSREGRSQQTRGRKRRQAPDLCEIRSYKMRETAYTLHGNWFLIYFYREKEGKTCGVY